MVANPSQIDPVRAELARLQPLFEAQRAAFAAHPFPAASERRAHLDALRSAVVRRQDDFVEAISADFGNRARTETRLAEVLTVLEAARHARRHVARWMRPSRRRVGRLMFSTRAFVHYQPLGVVGVIAPWNYPLLLSLGPLIAALAAGNRVMIKPSEFTPRTAALLADLVTELYDDDHVTVVNGAAEVSIAFTKLPLDHMLFTGSTGVGRHVMRAAAENLTPVTLELGGKSPAIITHEVSLPMAAERICYAKMINLGQTCVAPDYVLCPHDLQDEFVRELSSAFSRLYPSIADNADYTSIVNDRQYERLAGYLHDARTKEARVVELNPAGEALDHELRKLPLYVLLDVHDDMTVMQEEVFGPLLPVVPYDHIDDAIAFVNARPRPLALNLFDSDRHRIDRVMHETHSGGMCINDAVVYASIEDLPFGGVGASGMGRYHGHAGFLTFSNARAVFERPRRLNTARMFHPPYGEGLAQRLLGKLLR